MWQGQSGDRYHRGHGRGRRRRAACEAGKAGEAGERRSVGNGAHLPHHTRPTMTRLSLLLLAMAAAVACDESGNTLLPQPQLPADGLPAACSPLRTPGACMVPWPNAIYLAPDTTTPTGYRLHLDASTLPSVNVQGLPDGGQTRPTPFDPARWNVADGFSPGGES